MKPIWVVDDDQSIRFVLEKALAREQFSVRSFSSPRDVIKALEDDQKRRATRSLRDGIDRIMIDLLSLYRDILLIQLGVGGQLLINESIRSELERVSALGTPKFTLATLDAITLARERIEGNVTPTLALEAMLVTAVRRGVAR